MPHPLQRSATMALPGVETRPRSTSLMDQISDLSREKFISRTTQAAASAAHHHGDAAAHMLSAIRAAGSAWSNVKLNTKRDLLHALLTRMYYAAPHSVHSQVLARFALATNASHAQRLAHALQELEAEQQKASAPAVVGADEKAAPGPAVTPPPAAAAAGRTVAAVTRAAEWTSTVARLERLVEQLYACTLLAERDARVPFVCTCKAKVNAAPVFGSAAQQGLGLPVPRRASTLVLALNDRVQFARGKHTLATECLVGFIRKVNAHQVLVQLQHNTDPNSNDIPPSFWVRTDSGNIRAFPEPKPQPLVYGVKLDANAFGADALATDADAKSAAAAADAVSRLRPLSSAVAAAAAAAAVGGSGSSELPASIPDGDADGEPACDCIILWCRNFFASKGPDALFKLVAAVALAIAVDEASELPPDDDANAASGAGGGAGGANASLSKAAKVLGLPANAAASGKAARLLGLTPAGASKDLHGVGSPTHSAKAHAAPAPAPATAAPAMAANPTPVAAVTSGSAVDDATAVKASRALSMPAALSMSSAAAAAAAPRRVGAGAGGGAAVAPTPLTANALLAGLIAPALSAHAAQRQQLWSLVQEWVLKCAFQAEWLLLQRDKMESCAGALQGAQTSAPAYSPAAHHSAGNGEAGAAPAKEHWWERDLLEKTVAFFVAHTCVTPTVVATLFQCLVHKIVLPKQRAAKRNANAANAKGGRAPDDAEFPGVCVIAHPWVLKSLFMALTYCDSTITKKGLEQLTALVLMHGGNASIVAQQPLWVKWFAVLAAGGPSDALALAVSMRSSVSHRPPVWLPSDRAEILKLTVNLVVSIFYHRFCHPPEPPQPLRTGASKEAVAAAAAAAQATSFFAFVLNAFDDLEDALGWNWQTVNLQRVILMAFLAILGNRAHVLRSDFDHKSWPAVFDLMQVIEAYVFYSPILPEHSVAPSPAADATARAPGVTTGAATAPSASESAAANIVGRARAHRRWHAFGVHIDSTNTAADIPLVLKCLILLDAISLKAIRADALVEVDDRRALALKQKRLEDETAFLVHVNEYLNLLPKKSHMAKGNARTKALLKGMAETLQKRRAARDPHDDDDGSFLSRVGLTGLARSRRIKAIKKKLASAQISHTTDQAIVGLSTFNAAVQVKSARRIFGTEEKAKAYFNSRRRAILGDHKAALVSPLLVPKYDEAEDKESKAQVEMDAAAALQNHTADNDFFRTIVGRQRNKAVFEAPDRHTPVAVNSIISRRFNPVAAPAPAPTPVRAPHSDAGPPADADAKDADGAADGLMPKHTRMFSDFHGGNITVDRAGSVSGGSGGGSGSNGGSPGDSPAASASHSRQLSAVDAKRLRDEALGNTRRVSTADYAESFLQVPGAITAGGISRGHTPNISGDSVMFGIDIAASALPPPPEPVRPPAPAPLPPLPADNPPLPPTDVTQPPLPQPHQPSPPLATDSTALPPRPAVTPATPAPATPAPALAALKVALPPKPILPTLPRIPSRTHATAASPTVGPVPAPAVPPAPVSVAAKPPVPAVPAPAPAPTKPAEQPKPVTAAVSTSAPTAAPAAAAVIGGFRRPNAVASPAIAPQPAAVTPTTITAATKPAAGPTRAAPAAPPSARAPAVPAVSNAAAARELKSVSFAGDAVTPATTATVPAADTKDDGADEDLPLPAGVAPAPKPELHDDAAGEEEALAAAERSALVCTRCALQWTVDADFCEHDGMPYCDTCYLHVARSCRTCAQPFKENEAFISITDTSRAGRASRPDDAPLPLLYHLPCLKCHHCSCAIDVKSGQSAAQDKPLLPLPPSKRASTTGPALPSAAIAAAAAAADVATPGSTPAQATSQHTRAQSQAALNLQFGGPRGSVTANVAAAVYAYASHIYCRADFLRLFARRCFACEQPIESQFMSALGNAYHFDCFACHGPCKRVIRDGAFFPLSNRQKRTLSSQVAGADASTAAVDAKGNATDTDADDDDDDRHPYCTDCYTACFVPKCVVCSKAIESQGVSVNGAALHTSCARCCVAGCTVSANDDLIPAPTAAPPGAAPQLYCEQHYALAFATRCEACDAPCVTSSKVLGDCTYHDACFACSVCHKSLFGAPGAEAFSAKQPAVAATKPPAGVQPAAASAGPAPPAVRQRTKLYCRAHYMPVVQAQATQRASLIAVAGAARGPAKAAPSRPAPAPPGPAAAVAATAVPAAATKVQVPASTAPVATVKPVASASAAAAGAAAAGRPDCVVCRTRIADAQYLTLASGSFHLECVSCHTCGETLHTSVERTLADPTADLDGPSAVYEPTAVQRKAGPLPLAVAMSPARVKALGAAAAAPVGQPQTGVYCKRDFLRAFYRVCAQCDRHIVAGAVTEVSGTQYHSACVHCTVCKRSANIAKKAAADWKLYCRDHCAGIL